ncbi:MAG: hypothetical protein QF822_04390 [Candidatus Poseidoniia archaeon]|jgi:hypothetical protein|nr:hypothetical protein [Euryarchaeota archaeon]MDP6489263.1 hypothetical protein [Candidatus Poseidoniia archaeon]MDP6534439.1 hypothetical protein [Candidatus Poseidoniia archaeon]MDP6835465.1 hypothetical protein [Candidatus Poseidoniia archaeon]HIH79072.1 hypothetical protein [Candidatus Poseidoniia archaeon]|tara:strand:+ start:1077 stop:1652 length:576 start_codon:yes stop_codon:yes gene_type:complete
MVDFTITSAWYDSAALAAVNEQLTQERVVQLSSFFIEPLGQLPPAKHLKREERPGFAVRTTGPALLTELWHSLLLADWLAQATAAHWELRSCRHECYGPGDYSLLHDSEVGEQRLLLMYDLTEQPQALNGGHNIFSFADGMQTTCNRETGALVLALLAAGDLECMRYVSKLSSGTVRLEHAQFRQSQPITQ